MLKLRRGTVVEVGTGGLAVEVDGERRRAWADEAMVGRDARRRRGGRQHRGARPRARLRRLRRRPRQPDPGARRRRGRVRRPRDEAQLQLAAARRRPGRAARRCRSRCRRGCSRSSSCRCTATWPRPRGPPRRRPEGRRGSASSRLPAAACRDRSRATSAALRERGLLAGRDHRRRPPTGASTRRSASSARSTPPPARGTGTRSSSGRARGSSARRPATATVGWRRSRPPTPRWRSACRRSLSPRMSAGDPRAAPPRPQPPHPLGPRPAAGRGRGSGARRPRRSLAARGRGAHRDPRGGARGPSSSARGRRSTCRDTRSRGFRSGPWAGPSTRIGCSSPPRLRAAPRSPPALTARSSSSARGRGRVTSCVLIRLVRPASGCGCTGRCPEPQPKPEVVPAVDATPKPEVDSRFEGLLLDFLAYLEFERGLSRNTLTAYRTDLLQYGAFLAARGTGADRGRGRPTSPTSSPGSPPAATSKPPCSRRDAQPQDRLPALVLPPPAPRPS